MTCFVCDVGTLVRQTAKVEGCVKCKKYAVETMALVCSHCGHVAMEGKDTQDFFKKLVDAHRQDHQ